MSTMQEDLVARLTGATAIAAIVGDRVSWFEVEREATAAETYPALLLTLVSPGREWSHDGPDGLDFPRVQFDCWALDTLTALDLYRAVLAEMEQAADVGGTRFHEGFLELMQTMAEGEQADTTKLYRISCDFQFYHEEI